MDLKGKITISLPDSSTMEVNSGSSAGDIAQIISKDLYNNAFAAKVNGEVVDISTPIEQNSNVEILTNQSAESREILLHSTSHIMAQAVKGLYPDAKTAIGPSIENRFYYDFDIESPLADSDLEKIEKRMHEIIKADYPVTRKEISKEEALDLFSRMDEIYKIQVGSESN